MSFHLHSSRKDSRRKYLKGTKHSNDQIINLSTKENSTKNDFIKENDVDQHSTLKKFVDRFRFDDAQPRENRQSIDADLWWLQDELQTTHLSNEKSSQMIEIYPSIEIDDELNKRASFILNRTFPTESSDLPQISSTGIRSTMTSTLQGTLSTIEQSNPNPSRPSSFTHFDRTNVDVKLINDDEDILYQWRLRRRLEQAQNNEHISLPSKILKSRQILPSSMNKLNNEQIIPIRELSDPSPISTSISNTNRNQNSSMIVNRLSSEKDHRLVEVSTQTVQDVSIQTSLIIVENQIRSDEDDRLNSSVVDLPPRPNKIDSTSSNRLRKSLEKTFRPIILVDNRDQSSNIVHSFDDVQCSIESSLTEVTSIPINDRFHHDEEEILIDEEFSSDEILNLLKSKRDEILLQLKNIDQSLLHWNNQSVR